MTEPTVLETERLVFRYGKRPVLVDINLRLSYGVTVLLGRNGAGKTTLMRILAGAATPNNGEVRVDGEPSGRRNRHERQTLRQVGWLPQVFGFPPRMTATEFVAYAAWLKEAPREKISARVSELLRLVDLEERADMPLRTMSGGQLRRVGLAAAMAAEPRILILDEPTAGLDPEQRDAFHDIVRQLRKDRVVFVATHLLEDADALAEHIIVLDKGSVRWSGTPNELTEMTGQVGVAGLRHGFQKVIDNN